MLDNRLKSVSEFVDKCNVFMDIGTDHGYLPISLLENNVIKSAILTDINKGPLENSKNNVEKFGLANKCKFILTNGVQGVDCAQHIDVCSICGMGGEIISEIIQEGSPVFKSVDSIILQPMTNYLSLKIFLTKSNYTIIDEKIVKDKHLYYNIIKCRYDENSNCNFSSIYELEFFDPLIQRKDMVMFEYLKFRLSKETNILNTIIKNANSNSSELIINKERLIKEIKNRLGKYDS